MTNKRSGGRGRTTSQSFRGGLRAGLCKAIGGLTVAAALFSLSTAAHADCDVTDTGIPEDATFKADIGGVRQALARGGIGVGGYYYGETFYNWGGFDEGGEYDGVLELYVNIDMGKAIGWKGLCFFANGYQIHGNSITAANIG